VESGTNQPPAVEKVAATSQVSEVLYKIHKQRNTQMKFDQIAGSGIAGTRSLLSCSHTRVATQWRLYLSIYIICIGPVAAMGSGSGGGGGGGGGGSGGGGGAVSAVESNPLRGEVGGSAFKLYNQGVDLMHAKNFAAAQVKFEQAIRYKPDFAEAHNNLGFTLRQQGPQNYSKALQHYNEAIRLKPNMPETYEYRGVLFAKMGKKADAERDLATLKKLNPKLADELEEFLKTGKEEDDYGPISPKQKS
jgi:tetratricopeptide (TPR) repeat protein